MSKEKVFPAFNYKKCMACAICVSACPFGCLEMSKTGIDQYNKAYPKLTLEKACTGCGICSKECPFEAISMK